MVFLRRSHLAASAAVVACILPSAGAFLAPAHVPLGAASRSRAVSHARPMRMGLALEQFDAGGADPEKSVVTLDSLVPRAKVTELIKQTSDVEGAKQVLFNLLCYSVFASAAAASSALFGWASIGMAFVLSFNFMCLHETVHRSAFKSRVLNDIMMHVSGFSCLRPAQHYFYYHWGHHKYTGNPDKDSELQPSALDMDVSTLAGYLMYISGLPFWFDATTTTIRHALGKCDELYLNSPKAKKEVTNEARVYIALYAALAALSVAAPPFGAALLKFWVIPSVLGQPFLRFYLFAEHRGCPDDDSNITRNTRTMRTMWLYRKLAWNMPYHLEHHAWPYVPFHKLGDANKLLVASGGNEIMKGPCSPQGDAGYMKLNWHFIKSLFTKKDGPFPSGAA